MIKEMFITSITCENRRMFMKINYIILFMSQTYIYMKINMAKTKILELNTPLQYQLYFEDKNWKSLIALLTLAR